MYVIIKSKEQVMNLKERSRGIWKGVEVRKEREKCYK